VRQEHDVSRDHDHETGSRVRGCRNRPLRSEKWRSRKLTGGAGRVPLGDCTSPAWRLCTGRCKALITKVFSPLPAPVSGLADRAGRSCSVLDRLTFTRWLRPRAGRMVPDQIVGWLECLSHRLTIRRRFINGLGADDGGGRGTVVEPSPPPFQWVMNHTKYGGC
jgi:hypothetical protein